MPQIPRLTATPTQAAFRDANDLARGYRLPESCVFMLALLHERMPDRGILFVSPNLAMTDASMGHEGVGIASNLPRGRALARRLQAAGLAEVRYHDFYHDFGDGRFGHLATRTESYAALARAIRAVADAGEAAGQ